MATDTQRQQQANGKADTKAVEALEVERDQLRQQVAQLQEAGERLQGQAQQAVEALAGRNNTLADVVPYLLQLMRWQGNVIDSQNQAEEELRQAMADMAAGGRGGGEG